MLLANNSNNTNNNANKDNSNNNSANDELDDEAIAKGDEYNIAITGGPQVCSVLSVENPETDNNIYSIAPAEGQKPISMMLDPGCKEKSNPTKFPFGNGGFHSERKIALTYRKYFNQRLLNVDGR